jgi:hypothetical protein
MFHRINVLYSGYVGKEFDLPTARCLGNGMLHFLVIGEISFDEKHFPTLFPCHLLGLFSFLLVDVQAYSREVVGSSSDRGCSSDAAGGTGNDAHIPGNEIIVEKNKNVF